MQFKNGHTLFDFIYGVCRLCHSNWLTLFDLICGVCRLRHLIKINPLKFFNFFSYIHTIKLIFLS